MTITVVATVKNENGINLMILLTVVNTVMQFPTVN